MFKKSLKLSLSAVVLYKSTASALPYLKTFRRPVEAESDSSPYAKDNVLEKIIKEEFTGDISKVPY